MPAAVGHLAVPGRMLDADAPATGAGGSVGPAHKLDPGRRRVVVGESGGAAPARCSGARQGMSDFILRPSRCPEQ